MSKCEFTKSKASLTSQSHHWFITIRKNIDLDKSLIKQWCEALSEGDMYAFIEHKGDISVETGEVEGTHYHIVMNTKSRHMVSMILNNITDYFKFDNNFGIQVDIYSSFEGCLQYLTHQNNKDKTPHDKKEIIHNIETSTFETLMSVALTSTLTSSVLIGLITKAKTPIDLVHDLGLGVFDHYLKTIRVLWRYIKGHDL